MPHETHIPILKNLGLPPTQALIYEILLEKGPQSGASLTTASSLGRGNVYNALAELKTVGLVITDEPPGKVAIFKPADPAVLRTLAEDRRRTADRVLAELEGSMPLLTSSFRLHEEKPAVRFYEGKDGIRTVLRDSLRAKGTICTFADMEAAEKYVKRVNDAYVKERIIKKIPKKIIALDTPITRAYFAGAMSPYTEARLMPPRVAPFRTGMQIYGNTISYTTLTDKKMIGVIIEDEAIAQMHQSLFEYLWSILPPLTSSGLA